MDLNTIAAVARPAGRTDLPPPRPGDAYLAGGTWLFSEPQPHLTRLVDLAGLGWTPIEAGDHGLSIAATCTIAELDALVQPPEWRAGWLIGECCRAFLASFKIWNTATVGGNLCLALPAGPMIALCVALDARCTIWTAEGGERALPAADFVLDDRRCALAPGEVLRRIDIPAEALARRAAFRRASLTPLGRSAVLLIGTLGEGGSFVLTVTAATRRPVQLAFDALPSRTGLALRIDADIPEALYHDDVHGRPDWRRHMAHHLAGEILAELGAP